ncbi:glutathione S-transferase family protein [Pseudohalioglobus sediminis]|uniref:Glutathione S-transferase family protein n=1 Tax=Pseudohalioglobus sediminis TaxID=2606449 RepID=A0A5B0X7A4_9GAMM|nr:glutathione S-transferase family protein [Pseudohalioglobus sediminis]KAA1194347.1 glutathione S-transferase family protein [Pseudohalioglobus sediminis]
MHITHLKLYHFPMSRSARVKWLLHELVDDAFELETMRLYEGQQYQPDFLKRNPNHAVPVLEITHSDGSVFTMIESGAIVALLADSYPERRLAPPPATYSAERADYLQMLHFGASWFDMMLWQIRMNRDLLPQEARDEGTIDRYMEKIAKEVEPQLEARLNGGGYIAGEDFSAADCVMGHNVIWARLYGLCGGDSFSRYLETLTARPGFKAAFADSDRFKLSPR